MPGETDFVYSHVFGTRGISLPHKAPSCVMREGDKSGKSANGTFLSPGLSLTAMSSCSSLCVGVSLEGRDSQWSRQRRWSFPVPGAWRLSVAHNMFFVSRLKSPKILSYTLHTLKCTHNQSNYHENLYLEK